MYIWGTVNWDSPENQTVDLSLHVYSNIMLNQTRNVSKERLNEVFIYSKEKKQHYTDNLESLPLP